ncbi:adenylate/guanylate cyclase domain-containing protein [Vineibacter terrae]|uniref:adenylate/guanylate cyclase domain-containing protein n=1 Tax=Vineibacter terrae TaxID=2586908 RepID=UPI002E37B28B|nr:adenylate/guanylate cyclase domain-containing protein [Vineibacter terrae]HEX2890160.1 adenylate/guanylate cyclase domain-containing protein [Vineibacter terrae]
MPQRLRLISGITLFVFVTTHLLNHALGLFSIAAADAGLTVFAAVWRNPAGTGVLALAILTHFGLVLWSVFRRRRLRLSRWEWIQLALGLCILPIGLGHFVMVRGAHEINGVTTAYFWVLWPMVADPWNAARQFGLILIVWIHGCIGLHFWLRLKPWYRRSIALFYAAALMVPTLAICGVAVALREAADIFQDTDRLMALARALNAPPDKDAIDRLRALSDILIATVIILIALVLAARPLRAWWEHRKGSVRLEYPEGRFVSLPAGLSLLEMSRVVGIPHASVCGGRGRCSTCRVRIAGPDVERLPAASAEEARVLQRIGAPQGVRLACQTRPPPGIYTVTPMLPPAADTRDVLRGDLAAHGTERVVAVLFADLRDFTAISEKRLPFDIVFILNRYFRSMGDAVQAAGGHVDKFIGDGVMAVFGLRSDSATAARQALDAARRISIALELLNDSLTGELDRPLRIGLGIHAGPAIVGEMGHGRAVSLTAIGDTVNTASRLENVAKELGCELIVSQELLDIGGVTLLGWQRHDVEVRGRERRMAVRAVTTASRLPASWS